jgi:carboxyl-terminal processing protease
MKKVYLFLIAAIIFAACGKKDSAVTPAPTPASVSKIDLIKDSIYNYAVEEYLWYDAIPAYNVFNPHGFTGATDQDALDNEVDAISQYKINPATGKPYEYSNSYPGTAKYSFIDNGQVATQLGGTHGDFGFSVFYNAYNDLRVKYVNAGSPAATAGLARGYKVTAVNGSTNIAYNPNAANPNTDPNLLYVVNALGGNTITLTLQRPDNTTFTTTVAVGTYTLNPVLKYTTIDLGAGKKVGYIVFSSFTDPTNATPKLDAAFNSFTTAGITDLVVDLRYNGGGYVATAEYLDNLIVPAAKTNTKMYTEVYNSKLQADNYPLLAKKYLINPGDFSQANNTAYFSKKGSLNIIRVFFIVTGSTASASELTINNLIPQMDVKLIGTTSYGKPVGFFGIPISTYSLYVPEFETKNSANNGGYYAGMTPASTTYPGFYDYDDVTKDFGDPAETLFAHAISYITKGTYTSTSTPRIQSLTAPAATLSDDVVNEMANKLDRNHFTEMIGGKKLIPRN